VPNEYREEFINVGLVFHIPSEGFATVETVRSFGRIRAFDDEVDFELLKTVLLGIQQDLSTDNLINNPIDDPRKENFLEDYTRTFVNQIQFSDVRSILSSDPKKDFQNLVKLYLHYDFDKTKRLNERQIRKIMAHIFYTDEKYKRAIKSKPKISVKSGKVTETIDMDFEYLSKNHQKRYVKVLNLAYSESQSRRAINEARILYYEVEKIKSSTKADVQFDAVVYTMQNKNDNIQTALEISREISDIKEVQNEQDLERVAKSIKNRVFIK